MKVEVVRRYRGREEEGGKEQQRGARKEGGKGRDGGREDQLLPYPSNANLPPTSSPLSPPKKEKKI